MGWEWGAASPIWGKVGLVVAPQCCGAEIAMSWVTPLQGGFASVLLQGWTRASLRARDTPVGGIPDCP